MLAPLLALLLAVPASAGEVDVSGALAAAKKPRWEPKGQDAQTLRGRARTKLKGKKYEEAAAMYLELMGLQPGCGVCLSELTKALAHGGHHAEALRVAEHLTGLFPHLEDVWSRQLDTATLARDFDTGLAAVKKLQEKSPTSWQHRWTEVEFLLVQDRWDDALSAIEAASEDLDAGVVSCLEARVKIAKPHDGAEEAWAACAEAEGAEGVRDRVEGWRAVAIREWKTAALHAAQLGDSAAGDLAVAFLRIAEGKADSAVNLLDAAIEHEPRGRDLHVVRALAHYRAGDAEGAKEALGQLAALGDDAFYVMATAHSDWTHRMARHRAALDAAMVSADGGDATAVLAAAIAEHGDGPELDWVRDNLPAADGE